MASINVSAQGKLFFDFRFQQMRCREYTKLNDSPENRRKLKPILKRLEVEIALGTFQYEVYFPNSKRLAKLREKEEKQQQPSANKPDLPTFKEFKEQWWAEMSVGWRNSYKKTIGNLIDLRLLPTFGDKVICDINKTDVLNFRASLAKVTTGKNKTMSAQHINRHIKVLKMIINEAADRFDFNPVINGIKPLKPARPIFDRLRLMRLTKSSAMFDLTSNITISCAFSPA